MEVKFNNATITGTNRWLKVFHAKNPESEEEETEPAFMHKGERYFVSEFMRTDGSFSNDEHTFHAYMPLTAFHALLIKVSEDGERVKVFYYG